MDQININTLYQEIQKSFPHTEFLKDRLTFRIGKILQEHNFFSESSALVINRGGVYLLHQIPIDILLEGVSSFLKNELSCIESDYVEKLQGGIRTKLLSVIESGFNISTATEISEADLMKIFAYRITPDTLPFFIISNQGTNTPKRKFKVDNESDDTEICYSSHWFALIRPNDSSHIIIPSERIWIRFDSKKQFLVTESDHRVWGLGGGIFQLDKNLGKEIVHTQVDTGSMLGILEKISL